MRKIDFNQEDIVMVSACRTPFSKMDTVMKFIPSLDLGVIVMKEAIKRANVKPEDVDEMNYGSCILAEMALESDCPARQASIIAGFPAELLSNTMDRACCSSLTTMRVSMWGIRSGELKVALSVGAENMPRTPHLVKDLRWAPKIGNLLLKDNLFEMGYKAKGFNPLAVDAGEIAVQYGITREMQDEWALQSQERYFVADAAGKFDAELTPVIIPQKKGEPIIISKDESPRKTTLEKLKALPTIYGSPSVTAGNAPPLSAGASAILFMTRSEAEKRNLKPMATIVDCVGYATAPREIARVPAPTIQKALDRNGLTIDDMKLIEINEAFAAMPLLSTKMLADGNEKKWKELLAKTNVNGGAIAMGHPVGASAGRITMHLAHELARQGGGYGVAAICGGLAQGEAVILKV